MPPDTTTRVENVSDNIRAQIDALIRLKIRSGINFWIVDSKKILIHLEDNITLKNHVWQGANPNLIIMAKIIKVFTPLSTNKSANVEEKKNQSDATACVKKYLTLFSNWNKDPLAVKIGIKEIIFNSNLTQSLNQLFLRAARPNLNTNTK